MYRPHSLHWSYSEMPYKTKTQETKELAKRWLKGEISTSEVSVTLGGKPNQSNRLYTIAIAIRELYKDKELKIK